MRDHDSRIDLENIEVRGGHSRLSFFFSPFGILKIIVGLYAINKKAKVVTKATNEVTKRPLVV